jgi:hypothetical protein
MAILIQHIVPCDNTRTSRFVEVTPGDFQPVTIGLAVVSLIEDDGLVSGLGDGLRICPNCGDMQ